MIDIYIVYDNDKQIEKVRNLNNESLTFHFVDITTRKGKKEGWRIKNGWSARLNPFVLVLKDNNPTSVFYTEHEDVIKALLTYITNKQYEQN